MGSTGTLAIFSATELALSIASLALEVVSFLVASFSFNAFAWGETCASVLGGVTVCLDTSVLVDDDLRSKGFKFFKLSLSLVVG